MYKMQFIESPVSLQVQSTKSVLVKFCVFLHKFGQSAGIVWPSIELPNAVLKQRHSDSAIPRFESWRSSQPQRSLGVDSAQSAKKRHFRRLAAKSLVSGEDFRAFCPEGRESDCESLLDDFSISEIWPRRRLVETGCVSAETGSNPTVRSGSRAF